MIFGPPDFAMSRLSREGTSKVGSSLRNPSKRKHPSHFDCHKVQACCGIEPKRPSSGHLTDQLALFKSAQQDTGDDTPGRKPPSVITSKAANGYHFKTGQ